MRRTLLSMIGLLGATAMLAGPGDASAQPATPEVPPQVAPEVTPETTAPAEAPAPTEATAATRAHVVTPVTTTMTPTASADPVVVDGTAELSAQRATAWEADGSRFVLLQGRATVAIGVYGFEARRAVIRITPINRGGAKLYALAMYLDEAKPLAGKPRGAGDGARRSNSPGGSTNTTAPRLLVTATVAGHAELRVDLLEPLDTAPQNRFVHDALGRLARFDAAAQAVAAPPALAEPLMTDAQRELRDRRQIQVQDRRRRLTDAAAQQPPAELAADRRAAEDAPAPDTGVLPARGTVSYDMDTVTLDMGEDETVISLLGGVRVIFEDFSPDAAGRVVTLNAQRAVIFLRNGDDENTPPHSTPGRTGGSTSGGATSGGAGQLDAAQIKGIYLEDGAVISDGDYTVRAPRVYYDLAGNRAILLDAVLYTWDASRAVPLYLRADVIRQTAARSFTARDARFTLSEFHEPHIALGAGKITVSQYETKDGVVGSSVDASDVTLRVRDTPVFWLPRFAARGTDTPLRSVRSGFNSNDGVRIETTWDLFALLGRETPDGVKGDLQLDYLGEHGPGVGAKLNYQRPNMFGRARGYLLLNDNGDDNLPQRRDIEHDGNTRGFAQWQHRQNLENGFQLSVEAGYVDDPTFLEEFFPDLANEARPFESSIYLNRLDHETQFTALLRSDVNDFLPQLAVLQSPGYVTEKLPELSYRRVGTPLADGRLSWYSETTASNLRLRFGDDTPNDRGFNNAQALAAFGIPNSNTSFKDAAEARGLPTDTVLRFDTRQEISAPLAAGPIDITPFAVARLTAYDDDFADFNGGNDDQARLWGQLGTRIGTELHRSDDTVQNRVLDLDGIRHIIEPSATLAFAGTSIDARDLPTFDEDVESLAHGGTIKIGVVNTFQTRRGTPRRQRTVDWVVINSEFVFQSDDDRDGQIIGRFYDHRPELSRGGDHFYTELLWQITDAVGAAGEVTYSLESDRVEQWRLGAQMQHTPRLTSFLSYEEIEPVDSALLTYGFNYQLTTKYRLGLSQTLDFSGNQRRQLNAALERKLPRWRFLVTASWDQLEDEQSFGVVLIPDGFGNGRGLGSGAFFR